MDYIICHYGEIGLKGKNRRSFEEKLVSNIKLALRPVLFRSVSRISGRLLVKLNTEGKKKSEEIEKKLGNIFGISYFSFAKSVSQDIETIKRAAVELLSRIMFKTFKIDTKRSNKSFPLPSQSVNTEVGAYILETSKRELEVDLDNPEITCFIEIVEDYAFLYTRKTKGPGGLPVGISGKAISLLSGGIDSPVASYMALKRGLELTLLHFHALPYTDMASVEKVKEIAGILKKYQPRLRLYLTPFAEAQKQIVLNAPPRLRIVLYRRLMFRIAERIAEKGKSQALVTGENLGQVASQTIENMQVIQASTNMIVVRPLVGQDKTEIIAKAKEIGTYDVSIRPHQDCCSRFVPEHPETRANLKEVLEAEKNLNIESLIDRAVKKSSAS